MSGTEVILRSSVLSYPNTLSATLATQITLGNINVTVVHGGPHAFNKPVGVTFTFTLGFDKAALYSTNLHGFTAGKLATGAMFL